MVKPNLQTHLSNLTILLLITTASSSAYTPDDTYLLNCGSASSTTPSEVGDTRPFLPDTDHSSFSTSFANDASVQDPNPSPGTSDLYHTARIFTAASSYTFNIKSNGTLLVRLHFYAFPTPNHNLSAAIFDICANNNESALLRNFTTPRGTLMVKEFAINVAAQNLNISFTPSADSFAFVNAIEVFTAPTELFRELAQNKAMENLYRINVGGPKITPSNDTVWRTWSPDDAYLLSSLAGIKINMTRPIAYFPRFPGGSTREIAPDNVYNTAREMNQKPEETGLNSVFNVTWLFNISRDSTYLVRLHFCDIASAEGADTLAFNAYVNDNAAALDLRPYVFTHHRSAAPFYIDHVTEPYLRDPMPSALRVTIGKSSLSNPSHVNAILNGLEIFRLIAGPMPINNKNSVSIVVVIVPTVIGGVVLLGLLISAVLIVCRRRMSSKKTDPSHKWMPNNSHNTSSGLTEETVDSVSPNANLSIQISLANVKHATNGFDKHLVIGSGGFGKVYKGVLRDGTRVAVKRAARGSEQGPPPVAHPTPTPGVARRVLRGARGDGPGVRVHGERDSQGPPPRVGGRRRARAVHVVEAEARGVHRVREGAALPPHGVVVKCDHTPRRQVLEHTPHRGLHGEGVGLRAFKGGAAAREGSRDNRREGELWVLRSRVLQDPTIDDQVRCVLVRGGALGGALREAGD
ncbi:putative receptor-like protein kinase [Acorus calamus]|uniref:Receptor-like protein kinase n=1 Tax=Acorus calamus TaxID=4465 RepID=A0AAV9DY57_ACOCL|nr:putative receptor-like protein kinase [Acorus calamus]